MSTLDSRVTLPRAISRVARHDAPSAAFLRRYQSTAALAVQNGRAGIRRLWPHLLDQISDERNLRTAWDYLACYGGQAPGPNRNHYQDFADFEVWSLLRAMRDAIRSGAYRPGPVRRQQIPKTSGSGFRTLLIQNIEDRVVARGVKQIIEPLLDPHFDHDSYGFRPGRGRTQALAQAKSRTLGQDRLVWIVDDVKNAFDQIPRKRLHDVLRMPEEVVRLAMMLAASDRKRGIIQGNPLSPLLLNVYLDHFLDKPWRRQHPEVPLIRTADDILLCCRTIEQAHWAYEDLERTLTATGMPLKGDIESAVHDLRNDCAVDWLGYHITLIDTGLRVRISEKVWRSLANKLDLAHEKLNSPLLARETIKGWIGQMGPCYEHEYRESVCRRVLDLAKSLSFDEAASPQQLSGWWRRAHGRWQECPASDSPH